MDRSGYNIKRMSIIICGLMLMAVSMCSVYVERMLMPMDILEFIIIGIMILGWIIVFFGCSGIRKYMKEFKNAMTVSLVMIFVIIAQGLLAYRNYSTGLGDQSFIDFGVMLLSYIGLIGMFYVYQRLLSGVSYMVKMRRDHMLGVKCDKVWKKTFAGMIILLIALPLCRLFPQIIEYAATGILDIVLFILQVNMCLLLKKCTLSVRFSEEEMKYK